MADPARKAVVDKCREYHRQRDQGNARRPRKGDLARIIDIADLAHCGTSYEFEVHSHSDGR